MKNFIVLTIFIITLFAINSFSITADEIMDKAENAEKVKSSISISTQTIINSKGNKRSFKIKSWSRDEGKDGLSEYLNGGRVKGMKILMKNDGDDIWTYFKSTGRVRKIASHAKNKSVNGSDFTYDDMSTKDRKEDYDITLLGEEKWASDICYKLEFLPKTKKTKKNYSKQIAYVRKSDFLFLKADYFDPNGDLLKTLTLSNIKVIKGHTVPTLIVMENVQKNSKTIMETLEIDFDMSIDDKFFSERMLKR